MPPKKREKDTDSTKNPRIDHIQADHELFLQAFESKSLSVHYISFYEIDKTLFRTDTNL